MRKKIGVTFLLCAALVLLLFLPGCLNTSSVAPVDSGGAASLPPVPGFAGDIKDIVLPPEMEWDRKNSLGIQTESFRGGVYVYTGKVSVMSLKDFMVGGMQDNKWKKVGETASKEIMLAFTKPNKTCMMVLEDGSALSKTKLTFYVTIDETAATSMNPFGEAVSQ